MMKTKNTVRWMGIVGLMGGVTIIIVTFLMGDTFGYPGSAAYQRYQTFNRVIGFALVCASFAFVGLYWSQRGVLPRLGKVAFILTVIGLAGLALGNIAEFWVYSDLPYVQPPNEWNMRHTSFAVFSLGGLVLDIGSLLGGIILLRVRTICCSP